ncbi:uncharacterized protein BYT42DRAFT_159067 [Radiomyces spectabilis]|uniref:uncharacterized protein n=1 Tax=Radiomyces spectabilis TaxID=64574 RepID=UPI0022211EDF|nr:uncharacterized protein BYT42DRAFT_159067 [Radiomyces spectabilis]KAI8365285.1 hypothetical protein BYT42DRAFT_159067 [Radiomyces spectabilis]
MVLVNSSFCHGICNLFFFFLSSYRRYEKMMMKTGGMLQLGILTLYNGLGLLSLDGIQTTKQFLFIFYFPFLSFHVHNVSFARNHIFLYEFIHKNSFISSIHSTLILFACFKRYCAVIFYSSSVEATWGNH